MKVVFNMTDEQHNGIKRFQKDGGLFTMSEAIRVVCGEALKREYPNYIEVARAVIASKKTPQARADYQMAIAEAKSTKKTATLRDRGLAVCESLGGTITVPEGSEVEHCKYSMFTEVPGKKLDTIPMTVPLEDITSLALETQYRDMLGATGPEIREKLISYK